MDNYDIRITQINKKIEDLEILLVEHRLLRNSVENIYSISTECGINLNHLDDNLISMLNEYDEQSMTRHVHTQQPITTHVRYNSNEVNKILSGIDGMKKRCIYSSLIRYKSAYTSNYGSKLYEIVAFCSKVKPSLIKDQEFANIRSQINTLIKEKISLINEINNGLSNEYDMCVDPRKKPRKN